MFKKTLIFGIVWWLTVSLCLLTISGWTADKEPILAKQQGTNTEQKAEELKEDQIGTKTEEGTKTVKEKGTKELTDEEFINMIETMAEPMWRVFMWDKKSQFYIWNTPFKKLLQLELNFTPEQLDGLQKFVNIIWEWIDVEGDVGNSEYFLQGRDISEEDRERMRKELPLLKEKALEKKKIVMDELFKIRKIFINKQEKDLSNWFDETCGFFSVLQLTCTPRPKNEQELNFLKAEFFESKGYKKELEEKTSKFLLPLRGLNLFSSQETKIKDIIKDSIKKIDDLKAQLCEVQYGYGLDINIVENIAQLMKKRDIRIKALLTKEQILKFEKISK